MKMRILRKAPLAVVIFVSIMLFWTVPALCTDDFLMNDSDFMSKDEGEWGYIPNYNGMIKGDNVDWIWMKPGVSLTQFKTVEVPQFENLWKETDPTAQNLMTQNMKDGVSGSLGLKVVDANADITVKGAIVDYLLGKKESGIGDEYRPGDSLVEVEVYVVDNKTKEIISKVRHQVIDPTIDGAVAKTASDIVTEWSKR